MHRRTLGWLLITSVSTACAAREPASSDRDAASVSTPAPATTSGEQPAAPAGEIARQPPAPSDVPGGTSTGVSGGASGFRAPQENDAPPRPLGPVRPMQPPTLDGKRTAPVPPLDRSQTKTPPAER